MLVRDPLLTSRDGKLLLIAQALSFGAHGISSVALPWLVLDSHGSRSAAGLVFTFTTLPYVVFGLAAGVAGDRLSPRRVIWTTHALQAFVAASVPLWTIGGEPPLALALAAAFAIGAGRVFSDAAVFGLLAPIAGTERLTHAQATLGAAWSVGTLSGPALGGVLVAAIGPARALAIEAGLLVLAAVAVRALRAGGVPARGGPAGSPIEVVRAGLRTIFGNAVLRRLTTYGVSWVFVAAGAWALIVPLLRQEIELSSRQAGLALAAGGLAGIIASPVVGVLSQRVDGLRLITLGLPALAGSVALLGLAPGFAVALIAVFAFHLVDAVITAVYIGERLRRAPLELHATVGIFGRMLIMTALTTGSAVASAIADAVPLRWLYLGMAGAVALIAVGAGPYVGRAPAHGTAV